ncbi:MAG: undecaprenyl/decaprenyl-phosphate alpha-N-acetylglucosaminyl 1-phosphate transferase [Lentisphaeria bacterium]|nr:undecaprenyl/decaprenyl-phosphate alpha-N-acetylglucosaminyl 1-phosphate transferase [Lentisphaeria bacterium]
MNDSVYIVFILLFSSFVLSIFVNPLMILFAKKIRLVDNPDGYRKIHVEQTPLSGGLSIVISSLIIVIVLQVWHGDLISIDLYSKKALFFWFGCIVIFILGLVDDYKDLRPKVKLSVQFTLALLLYFGGGFSIERISLPFGLDPLDLAWLSLPFTIFWILAVINAVNLLDGMDGLAGGVGFLVMLTLAIVSFLYQRQESLFIAVILAGIIAGFLLYNFNPAKCFLGDSGSMLIGYFIAIISLWGALKGPATVSLFVPIVCLGLPVFDTSLAILRRWSKGLPLSAADRKHIHHVLLEMGFSQKKVALILYCFTAVLGGIGLLITAEKNSLAFIIIVIIVFLAIAIANFSGMIDMKALKGKLKEDYQENKLKNKAAVEVEKATHLMGSAESVEGLWESMVLSCKVLKVDRVSVEITLTDLICNYNWQYKDNTSSDVVASLDSWSLFVSLHTKGVLLGELHVWKEGGETPIREITVMIQKLRVSFSENFYRIYNEKPTNIPKLIDTDIALKKNLGFEK